MFTQRLVRLLALAAAALPFALALPSPAYGGVDVKAHGNNLVADKYLVIFKKDARAVDIASHTEAVVSFHANNGARLTGHKAAGVEHHFAMGQLKGYTGGFDTATLKEISKSPLVN